MIKYSATREQKHFDNLVKKTGETNYANLMPVAKTRFSKKAQIILTRLKLRKNFKILELGCGTGLLSNHLLRIRPDLDIVGVDLSTEAIAVAKRINKKYKYAKFISGDALHLPFKSKSFDAVIGNSVLHHLPLEKSLKEVYRILNNNGLIWFSEPNVLNPQIFLTKNVFLIKKMLQDSPSETAFNRWDLKKDLLKYRYVDISIEPFDFFHPLIPKGFIKYVSPLFEILEETPLAREFAGGLKISASVNK